MDTPTAGWTLKTHISNPSPMFEFEGRRYVLWPYRDAKAKRPFYATIVAIDGPKDYWEISRELVVAPRNRTANLDANFVLEYREPAKREMAERLVARLLELGLVNIVCRPTHFVAFPSRSSISGT